MNDVQELLGQVEIRPDDDLTNRYPKEMPVRISFHLKDGRTLTREQDDYEGAVTRPMNWARIVKKFMWLVEPYTDDKLRAEIIGAVAAIRNIKITDLTGLLGRVSPSPIYPSTLPPV
jgi:2-methylcitrate dehydratase